MKRISFRDMQLASPLKGLNEIAMLHPDNDEKMRWVMAQCGIDIEYEIEYVPCLHRDMQGKVGVGYCAVGELNINRRVLNSPVCDITDRLVAAGMQDPSLARELAGMLSSKADYRHLSDDIASDGAEDESVTEEYEWVAAQIKQLEIVRDEIRGTHSSTGSSQV